MASFFKTFFLGILITILLPFIAALLAIFFVYCLIVFIIMGIRNIIVFFTGGSPNGDLPEDIQAKRILAKKQESEVLKSVEQNYGSTSILDESVPVVAPKTSSIPNEENISDVHFNEKEEANPIMQNDTSLNLNDVVDISEDNKDDHID